MCVFQSLENSRKRRFPGASQLSQVAINFQLSMKIKTLILNKLNHMDACLE